MRATLMAVVVVGLTLLAGGGRCLSDYMTGDAMEVMVGELESRGLKDDLNPLYSKAIRHCTCIKLAKKDASREETCQCIAEVRACDDKYRPTSHSPGNDFSERYFNWITCVGEEKFPAVRYCSSFVFTQPLPMICQAKALHCEPNDTPDHVGLP
ncbi:uncharacterized protein LOC123518226 [Portunus trituberculatus]|uniref:uncharacterized protein LOC123518226 n=1 Tax=Portunus trituberculatus TaxID=210409 RepID=UPI001E1CF4E4|nr:uncharacterized protein LOC123518226 [Portunus trituberculatus]